MIVFRCRGARSSIPGPDSFADGFVLKAVRADPRVRPPGLITVDRAAGRTLRWPAREDPMRPEILGLGWFVRRSPDAERLVAFYRDVIGFPILRRHGSMTAFWTGETVAL